MVPPAVRARRHQRTGLPSWSRATLQCVDSAREVAAHRFAALSFDLGSSRTWSLESFLARRAPLTFQKAEHVHSWVFTLLQGVTGDHPSAASRNTRAAPTNAVPLVRFWSLQRSRARRSRSTRRFHPPAPCVFRVRALLTPCSPSSLPAVSDGAAPGIPTFRAFYPLEDPGALSSGPEPSCRCSSQPRHASNVLDRTWPS